MVTAATLGILCGACGASSTTSSRSTTTKVEVPDLPRYSSLTAAQRSERVQSCRELSTIYGSALSAMTTSSDEQLTKSLADLDALQAKLPSSLSGDLQRVHDAMQTVHDDPKHLVGLMSPDFTKATGRIQSYVQAVCDVRS